MFRHIHMIKEYDLVDMMKLFLLLAVTSFALISCDSPEERARKNEIERKADALEDKADQTRKATENVADKVEEKKADVDAAADAIRNEGERKADALENAADAEREKK